MEIRKRFLRSIQLPIYANFIFFFSFVCNYYCFMFEFYLAYIFVIKYSYKLKFDFFFGAILDLNINFIK